MREFSSNWDKWNHTEQPLPQKVSVFNKISFCTTCHNRAKDLRKTLVQNIRDNLDYPNLEFVVLNYNSGDDLHKLMQLSDLRFPIKLSKVKYFITRQPQSYNFPHSKNVAFRAASGKIVVNIDADAYTGKGFASFINAASQLCPTKAFFSRGEINLQGRVGMYKTDFEALGGYNEEFTGYGFDEYDLMMRAMSSGFKLMGWECQGHFNNRIPTPESALPKDWRETLRNNRLTSICNVNSRLLVANKGKSWGQCGDLFRFCP